MNRSFSLALIMSATTASAAVTFDGITLHNGLSSLTDDSAIGFAKTEALAYLTDADLTTVVYNLGALETGSLQGVFTSPVLSTDTGVYVMGIASAFNFDPGVYSVFNGTFSLQLVTNSGLSSAITFDSTDYTITSQAIVISAQVNAGNGSLAPAAYTNGRTDRVAYLFASFDDFGVHPTDVIGVRFSDFTSPWLDVSYIGTVGSSSPIPEPSTYGLVLGVLALAGVAIRRRQIKR